MPKLKPDTIWPTEEEDREITRQAREDGTLYTDEELAEFKPFEASDLPESFKQAVRRRGRPRKANPKVSVHIRFSPEVIAHFKVTGKGWQTRMDEALKEWIAEHEGTGTHSWFLSAATQPKGPIPAGAGETLIL